MASWRSRIQLLRSSLERAWTSTISGLSVPAVMRNRPRSSLATSRTISLCREITVDRWSCRAHGWEGRTGVVSVVRERGREREREGDGEGEGERVGDEGEGGAEALQWFPPSLLR